jgi:DNA-binding MarR family transcriptional regulator
VRVTARGERLLTTTNELADEYLARQLAELANGERRALERALPALERLLEVKA